MANHPKELRAWRNMRYRCEGRTERTRRYYAGVSVCARWLDWEHGFEAFLADLGPAPSPRHTLDRYPNRHGDYEPGNVRWATWSEQNRNKDAAPRGRRRGPYATVKRRVKHQSELRLIARKHLAMDAKEKADVQV